VTPPIKNEGIEIRGLYKVFGTSPRSCLPLIRDGISKSELLEHHNHVLALEDINLSVAPHSIHVIMGLSGSGKSTLIRHVNRLIDPTDGIIRIGTEDVLNMDHRRLTEFRRNKVSMVFQRFALLPHYDVAENVSYGLKAQGLSKAQREKKAADWIVKVGLEGFENAFPHQLSGGMQQRVGLARALATDTNILLMDEAFSALDPLIRSEMQELLLHLQTELKKTILFVTHDLDEAIRIGERIAILRDGLIVQNDTSQGIVLNPADDYIAEFTKGINRGRVIEVGSILNNDLSDQDLTKCPSNTCLEDGLSAAMNTPDGRLLITDDQGNDVGILSASEIVAAMQVK